jgi:hypothetical protein
MLSTNELEKLTQSVINKTNKKNNEELKQIIIDIKQLDKTANLHNKKQISRSSLMNEVRFLKGRYSEALKETISEYQTLIFEGYSYKNDLNALINGSSSLKLWLTRYLCLCQIQEELKDIVSLENEEYSITEKYKIIDEILFLKIMNSKVTN